MFSRLYAGVMTEQLASGAYIGHQTCDAHMLTLHGRILDIEVICVAL